MNYFEEVKKELFKYKNLGEERTQNGTTLIGRAPHIAEFAWLHKICPVLSDEDILRIETELNTKVPKGYRFFLQDCSNGLGMFVSTFSLYGLRKELGRSIEASRQPFSLNTSNIDERAEKANPSYFFIGGYNWDGSKLYIDAETGIVHYCGRWDATSLYQWNSFGEMLLSETKRLASLFDNKGIIINKDLHTTPVEIK